MKDEQQKTSQRTGLSDPATWVDEYGDFLYRYAMQRLREKSVAEDVVQETFLAALAARDSFAGQSTERTWLVGILKRKIVDHFRKSTREVDFDEQLDPGDKTNDDYRSSGLQAGTWKSGRKPDDWIIDPTDSAEQGEFWRLLNICIDGLDARHGVAFVLREMEEMEGKAICNVMDISPTNLRVMLYRARKQLRRCLELKWMKVKDRS